MIHAERERLVVSDAGASRKTTIGSSSRRDRPGEAPSTHRRDDIYHRCDGRGYPSPHGVAMPRGCRSGTRTWTGSARYIRRTCDGRGSVAVAELVAPAPGDFRRRSCAVYLGSASVSGTNVRRRARPSRSPGRIVLKPVTPTENTGLRHGGTDHAFGFMTAPEV